MVSGPNLCVLCKGTRALCGHELCPKLASIRIVPEIKKSLTNEFFGPSPSVFVGHMGYPRVNVGPMGTLEQNLAHVNDDPREWLTMDYSKIIELRATLLRSKRQQSILAKSGFISELQELAMASTPTDVEMRFDKKPSLSFSFSNITPPIGASASLEKLRVAENPQIDSKVDYIVHDELKAAEQAVAMYSINVDVYKITNILSTGALGLEQNRKIVPTRWSITATDDIVGKELISRVKEHPSVNEFLVFKSNELDNHFIVMLMPGMWEFENFEAWAPGGFWTQGGSEPFIIEEYESFMGRKKYAEKQAGGYYASRLGVVEALNDFRRQARVVVFREVNEGYVVPLGVWQVRENVRNAMRQIPVKFGAREEALKHVAAKLRLPLKRYMEQSVVLRQRRLSEW